MTTWTGYVSEQPFAVSQKAKGAAMASGLNVKQEIPERSVTAVGKKDFDPTALLLWGIYALPIFWIMSSLLVVALFAGGAAGGAIGVLFWVWVAVYWLVPLIIYFIRAKQSTIQVTIQKRSAGSFVTIIAEGISGNAALGMLVIGLNTNVTPKKGSSQTGTYSGGSSAGLTEVYGGH